MEELNFEFSDLELQPEPEPEHAVESPPPTNASTTSDDSTAPAAEGKSDGDSPSSTTSSSSSDDRVAALREIKKQVMGVVAEGGGDLNLVNLRIRMWIEAVVEWGSRMERLLEIMSERIGQFEGIFFGQIWDMKEILAEPQMDMAAGASSSSAPPPPPPPPPPPYNAGSFHFPGYAPPHPSPNFPKFALLADWQNAIGLSINDIDGRLSFTSTVMREIELRLLRHFQNAAAAAAAVAAPAVVVPAVPDMPDLAPRALDDGFAAAVKADLNYQGSHLRSWMEGTFAKAHYMAEALSRFERALANARFICNM